MKVEKQNDQKLKVLKADGEGEYKYTKFQKFCEENIIEHEVTAPYTPQHNGHAGIKNITLLDMTRSMMKEKKLSHAL